MKTVYFIRHAKSSWSDMSLRDFDRPLNKRGKRDAPFMAEKLNEFGIQPDAILSSPANRAITTAKHFAKVSGFKSKDIIQVEGIYEAWGETVIKIIQALPDQLETILIFGHNPAFTMITNSFEGGESIDNVPTCGIVKVQAATNRWQDFEDKTGKVCEFYYPKQYFD